MYGRFLTLCHHYRDDLPHCTTTPIRFVRVIHANLTTRPPFRVAPDLSEAEPMLLTKLNENIIDSNDTLYASTSKLSALTGQSLTQTPQASHRS